MKKISMVDALKQVALERLHIENTFLRTLTALDAAQSSEEAKLSPSISKLKLNINANLLNKCGIMLSNLTKGGFMDTLDFEKFFRALKETVNKDQSYEDARRDLENLGVNVTSTVKSWRSNDDMLFVGLTPQDVCKEACLQGVAPIQMKMKAARMGHVKRKLIQVLKGGIESGIESGILKAEYLRLHRSYHSICLADQMALHPEDKIFPFTLEEQALFPFVRYGGSNE